MEQPCLMRPIGHHLHICWLPAKPCLCNMITCAPETSARYTKTCLCTMFTRSLSFGQIFLRHLDRDAIQIGTLKGIFVICACLVLAGQVRPWCEVNGQ